MKLSARMLARARRLKQDGAVLWFACRHAGTPLAAKLLCALVVAYALSPVDLIPDFIPVLGYLDEVIILPGLIWLAVRLIPPDVLAECRTSAAEWIARNGRKPRSRWGILLVVAVWMLALWAIWEYGFRGFRGFRRAE